MTTFRVIVCRGGAFRCTGAQPNEQVVFTNENCGKHEKITDTRIDGFTRFFVFRSSLAIFRLGNFLDPPVVCSFSRKIARHDEVRDGSFFHFRCPVTDSSFPDYTLSCFSLIRCDCPSRPFPGPSCRFHYFRFSCMA